MLDAATFDSRDLRRVLGTFVTGVTVVTTIDHQGQFHGVTANSFSSVSLDPPLVLWSQAVKSHSHPAFFNAERFAVNILAEDQIDLSKRFAKSSPDKFAGIDVDIGESGVPLLRDCSARLQCRVVSRVPGGDHTIYVAEVLAIDQTEREPLVFGNGRYLLAYPHDLADAALSPHRKQAQLTATRLGARAVERLARRFDETMALAVWGAHGPTITHWEPASAPVSEALPVGLILPVTSTATGLAFAAHLCPEAIAQADLPGQNLAPGEGDWHERLAEVRRRGLARQGLETFYRSETLINALSAPVLDADGHAVLALTAVGEANRFRADLDGEFARALRETARDLSHRLGYETEIPREPVRRPALAVGA
ncbi:flavin reductase [Bradyrhizobium sp. CB1650]|uniref:flavin reductase n=1 Tax=Bradyrhizobium sp. CB1650 TaxID=3039153 RepID=UPI002434DCE9|nr:flavin reductase [Bradyrhizobium sp. CB1650]WGD50188.1 flavin reductase [Bradyrhizobium sp. CB1650]